jgi:hypothetical protein
MWTPPDVIAAFRLLGEVINEGSKLRPPGRKQSLTMKAEDWIWSAVLMTQYEAL